MEEMATSRSAGVGSASRIGAVIVAAGRAARMGGLEKMMVPLAGRPIILHSMKAFQDCEAIDEIIVVARAEMLDRVHELVDREGLTKVSAVVRGGKTRTESTRHGLGALSQGIEVVLVHDGARPLISLDLIERVARSAASEGAVIPGVCPVATIKRAQGGESAGTLDRTELREAQTPQGFRRVVLAKALAAALKEKLDATDEAMCVERLGERIVIVEGERRNLKVTVPEDLAVAEALVSGSAAPQRLRIGFGHDVHRLVKGRRFILGGVEIPHLKGLEGHSDADVLSHAICDALLGAASQGDLGEHFPDSDARWKDVSGLELAVRTVEILREVGYVPVNVDSTVNAQAPRLAPHRDSMIENLAKALALPEAHVSVKFTTTEHLGFEGRGDGVSATAVAQVSQLPQFSERS
jgi:2-C-methyl-D-erythritol 4-phosphate cytidylyltransferase/2-C-methyl-D-erythritol 2,4-cyclodiphosphate synthase